jgi:hypothetical protein
LINPNKKRGIEIKVEEGYTELTQTIKPKTRTKFASINEKRITEVQKKYNRYAIEKYETV